MSHAVTEARMSHAVTEHGGCDRGVEVGDLAPGRPRDRTGLAELLAADLCGLDLVARMVDGSESPSAATWWRWDHP
jgi:hypothetical protein